MSYRMLCKELYLGASLFVSLASVVHGQSVTGFVKDLEGEPLSNVVVSVFRVTAGTPVDRNRPIDRKLTGPDGKYTVITKDATNVTLFFDGRQANPKPVTSAFVPQEYLGGNVGGSIRMVELDKDGKEDDTKLVFRNVTDMNVGLPERRECQLKCPPRRVNHRRCR